MCPLTQLQQWFQRVYEIEVEHDVMDFLITDRKLVMALQGGEARPDCPEKLLLHESPDELEMSLYLSPEVLQALAGTALVFFSLSAYALNTKKDFSYMGGFLMTGLIVAVVAMIAEDNAGKISGE